MILHPVPLPGGVCAPRGFSASGVPAGIKPSGRPDVALVATRRLASAAGVFTTNRVVAAPILVCKEHLEDGLARAIIVNAGCANACTGAQGLRDARRMTELTASLLGLDPDDVLVASTGVIGRRLPMERVEDGIRAAVCELSEQGGESAAMAIMTTDTRPKLAAAEVKTPEGPVRVGGMCKGSGMIAPNMATMLAFLTTDAAVEAPLLQSLLSAVAEQTFNCVTVDGDTSTNDTLLLLANGASGVTVHPNSPAEAALRAALLQVCTALSRELARDGEGATKLVAVHVTGAASPAEARRAALAIANSPLVKTALFGNDPNWGRILCAAGYSGASLVPERLELTLCGVPLVRAGEPLPFDATAASAALRATTHPADPAHAAEVVVHLGAGNAEATVWTCDLSYDYVRINAEYTT
jgi:glutamate N-acetyltransferase/amino-acid N-acetyltransferase